MWRGPTKDIHSPGRARLACAKATLVVFLLMPTGAYAQLLDPLEVGPAGAAEALPAGHIEQQGAWLQLTLDTRAGPVPLARLPAEEGWETATTPYGSPQLSFDGAVHARLVLVDSPSVYIWDDASWQQYSLEPDLGEVLLELTWEYYEEPDPVAIDIIAAEPGEEVLRLEPQLTLRSASKAVLLEHQGCSWGEPSSDVTVHSLGNDGLAITYSCETLADRSEEQGLWVWMWHAGQDPVLVRDETLFADRSETDDCGVESLRDLSVGRWDTGHGTLVYELGQTTEESWSFVTWEDIEEQWDRGESCETSHYEDESWERWTFEPSGGGALNVLPPTHTRVDETTETCE